MNGGQPALSAGSVWSASGLQIDHLGLQVLIQAVAAICAADPRLTPAGVEPLHRLKVLTVDIGFAKLQSLNRFHRHVQIAGID